MIVTRGLGRPGALLVSFGLGAAPRLRKSGGALVRLGNRDLQAALRADDEEVMEIEMTLIAFLLHGQ